MKTDAAKLLALALLGLACGPGMDKTHRDSADESTTVTVLYPIDEYGLGPSQSTPAQYLVFLPLVARNVKGELEPRLARSWEHSPDYREWTIRLRTDVRWHDGVPVTAHDIKFTLDLFARPETLWGTTGAYDVTVLNDSTYQISFKKGLYAVGSPLDDYNVYYPKHHLEGRDPADFYEWEFWKHPVGNGPYRYVRTAPGIAIELEANPDYFRGKPAVERVVLKFGEGSLVELLSGNVDVLPYVSDVDLVKLKGEDRFEAYRWFNSARVKTIAWNHDHELFRDQRVREALTLAIDRRELYEVLNLPADLPVFDAPFTVDQFRRRDLPAGLSADPERASQLLEAAGWRDLDRNGVLERHGIEFRFDMQVPMGGGAWTAQGSEKAAVYIEAQLRRVGVAMHIQTLEGLAARQRFETGDFQAAIRDITYGSKSRVFGEDSPLGYRDAEVIELLEEIEHTLDPDALDGLHRQLAVIFQRDLPVTFLYPSVVTTVAHRRIRGLSTPYRADPVWYMEELWIEEEHR